jgi:glycine cleavage system H protein
MADEPLASGDPAQTTLFYKRANFVTHLPVGYRYSLAHAWAAGIGPGRWRVGLTKFATRMLGEMVDHAFQVEAAAEVTPGQIIGWLEGFKAISDLYCLGRGRFVRGNPELQHNLDLVHRDPFGEGWLYEFDGEPDPACVDVDGYRALLDATIDKLLEKQQSEEGG